MDKVEKIAKDRLLSPQEISKTKSNAMRGQITNTTEKALLEAQDAKTAQAILSDPNIVEVDRNAELPKIPLFGGILAERGDRDPTVTAYKLAQQDMLKAGWVLPKKEKR